MDTPPEEEFDRLVELASRVFKVPTVLISLLDRDRQFFKARIGIDVCETDRDVSLCAHAIVQDDILFIPDTLADPRFAANPLVLGPPNIRFYAGKPLIAPTGEKLGTVCLIDREPRAVFTADDRKNLVDLAELVMDRMELRRLDRARSISQSRFENIAATSPDAIICSNVHSGITFWNKAAETLFGFSAEEAYARPLDIIIPDSWRALYDRECDRLRRGRTFRAANKTAELSGRHRDGREFPAEFSLSAWVEGDVISVGAIIRDITERHRNEERLYRLASLDPLTELSNRATWQATLAAAFDAGRPVSLLLLDLDGFKDVNDTLGHSAGDAVLQGVAARLNALCGTAIILARLGGDEFVVLIPGDDDREAGRVAAALVAAIAEPFEYMGEKIFVGVSIGIASAPQHGGNPQELLGAADLALYRAKAAGRGRFELFTPAFRQVAVARRAFEQELRRASDLKEFELYYQPQVGMKDGQVTGAEALIRWNHPERGLLSPAAFIDVLGEGPLAATVGEWTLRAACRQAAEWRASVPHFRMGVNLFEEQFRSGRLIASVESALAEAKLAPEALELELVENILLRNDSALLKLLNDLRSLGIGLSFDDYGTGFASLSLLKRFPVTRLKIDRSFVRDVYSDPEDAAVVRAVLYLGRSFKLEVIAEGVETESQRNFLCEQDCAEAQGYLFGKPMPAAEFSRIFLDERQAA